MTDRLARVRRALGGNGTAVDNASRAVTDAADGRRRRAALHPGAHPPGPGHWLDELSAEECWRRLSAHHVGRIAFTAHSGSPVILPVNYAVHAGTIVIRSGRGPKIVAASRRALVAFEIDEIDPSTRSGWSVVVNGRARLAADPAERAGLMTLGLQPWAAGPREEFIVVEPRHVAGRELLSDRV